MISDNLMARLRNWSSTDTSVLAIGLVGSFARGEQRPDSDIDLIVIVEQPRALLDDLTWLRQFGTSGTDEPEEYGLVQSLRCIDANGREIEFAIAGRVWCRPPIDVDTATVIAGGLVIIDDPFGHLQTASDWVSRHRSG